MKKTVFAIWGHEKQGKSSTVREIAQLILKHYPTALTNPIVPDFSITDVKLIIHIGNVKIGVEGQGDPGSRIFQSLKEFVGENCDIIICSTRTSGATVAAVNDLYKNHHYDIIWTTNYRSQEKSQQVLNAFSGEHIFQLIQEVLANRL